MLRAGSKTIKSWIIIYAGFMAAIVFAEQGIAMPPSESGRLSPVAIQADAPALTIEPVIRRSDI